jgi:hypothetical protein
MRGELPAIHRRILLVVVAVGVGVVPAASQTSFFFLCLFGDCQNVDLFRSFFPFLP